LGRHRHAHRFIAFLVCFELPRSETLFSVDEAAKLGVGRITSPRSCHRTIDIQCAISLGRIFPARGPIKPFGFILMRWVDRSGSFSSSKTVIRLRLRTTFAQHKQLVVRLFGSSASNIAVPPVCEE